MVDQRGCCEYQHSRGKQELGTQHRAPRPRSFTEVEPVSKPRNKELPDG